MEIESITVGTVLSNYGIAFKECRALMAKTLDEPDPVLRSVYETLKHAVKTCVVYGVNKGFTRDIIGYIGQLGDLMYVIATKQESIVAGRKVKKYQKQVEKMLAAPLLRDIATKPLATLMESCSCGFAQALRAYIKDTARCVRFLRNEVETLSAQDYVTLAAQANLGDMALDDWRARSLNTLQTALTDLDTMADLCDNVLDNSSVAARNTAIDVVRTLIQWRTKMVYAYLTFVPETLILLSAAQTRTCQWRLRAVGINPPDNNRDERPIGDVPVDVLGEYVNRYTA